MIGIGAGIVGSSVAMALAGRRRKALAIDIDLRGASWSEKNAGGVRATWWRRVNITLCRASSHTTRTCATTSASAEGILWLYDADTFARALSMDFQRQPGIRSRHSRTARGESPGAEIDRLEVIEGATFSPHDGLINPNLLKKHYRARALKLGAQFRDRAYVVAIDAGASDVRLQRGSLPSRHERRA